MHTMIDWSPLEIGQLVSEMNFEAFAIYSLGGHLGHVTWTIHKNFGSPLPWDAPHKV